MTKYIVRRLWQSVLTLLGLSLLIFVLIRVVPGDPVGLMFSPGMQPTQEDMDQIRRNLGLDQPIPVQYLVYLRSVVSGDLGHSYQTNTSALALILRAAPATIELAIAASVFAILIGTIAGIVSAVKQYSVLDYGTIVGATIGVSAPVFWTGLLLILVFSVNLQWFPVSGRINIRGDFEPVTNFYILDTVLRGNWGDFIDALRHLMLPAFTLGFANAALIARITRSAMLEVLSQNYIITARAKGVSERVVVLRHALSNASIPVLTIIGLQMGYLLGGAVLTETVFNWPGLGSLLVSRIEGRDYPVVQGIVLVIGVAFVVINLIVDILYALVDPRVRYE
jgi:peptide/nickel transport system permease protein